MAAKKKAEPPTIEGQVVAPAQRSESLVLSGGTPTPSLMLMPVMNLELAKKRLQEFQAFVAQYLVKDEDFGHVPGIKKAFLFKPGADKLCELYGLADTYPDARLRRVEDWTKEPPLFDYEVTCVLISKGTQLPIAEGLGSCNSWESKYRWREGGRACPQCQAKALIKEKNFDNKRNFVPGWLCWGKKGGCGARFAANDPAIMGQSQDRVINEDVADIKNTILKMACKRAKIAATISATRSSGIFTQDEDAVKPGVADRDERAQATDEGNSEPEQSRRPAPLEFAGTVVDFVYPVKYTVVGALKLNWTDSGKKERNEVFAVTNPNVIKVLQGSKGETVKFTAELREEGRKKFWQMTSLLQKGKYDFTDPDSVEAYHRDMEAVDKQAEHDKQPATPVQPAATQEPAKPKGTGPTIEPIKVPQEVGRGANKKTVETTWYTLEGIVIANSGVRETVNKALCVTIGIDALPDYRANPKGQHNRFDCYHKSLHAALSNAKPNSVIKFQYFPETNKEGKVTQYIEALLQIDDLHFDKEGKIVQPVSVTTEEDLGASPRGLF
jgi:hypothetical protein